MNHLNLNPFRLFWLSLFSLSFFVPFQSVAQQKEWIWKKIERNGAIDTVFLKKGFLGQSIKLFRPNGDLDSTSSFKILPEIGFRLNYYTFIDDSYFWVAYQIPIVKLFAEPKKMEDWYYEISQLNSDSIKTIDLKKNSGTKNDLFGNSTIKKNGALTRGITVGSNQDASLESGLRLELEGQITDSLYILANLTDQSTPIQPDGTTQNLREFDRVYIKMKSPKHQLELGDIDVLFNKSSFAFINRRLQGLQYNTTPGWGSHKAMASVARGLFKTQTLEAIDGVQGPYRLTGNLAEPFIIVIAGTERVYLDGRLLQRGEDRDYIIDYGIGEILFMPRILINQRSRIVVDFQYLNQDFSRSLVAVETTSDSLFNNKLILQVNYMRETDNDNSLAQISLSENDISILKLAGDDDSKAVVSGVVPLSEVDLSTSSIVYIGVDSIIDGNQTRIYKYVTDYSSHMELFEVKFARVLNGAGNYKRKENNLNGVVYEFAGFGHGAYDTLRSLPRPIDHQMLSIQSHFNPTKSISMHTEWAISQYDKNKFSDLDDNENADFAINNNLVLSKKTEIGLFESKYHFKYNGNEFRYFDRPEQIDFQRSWNLPDFSISKQTIHEASINLTRSDQQHYRIILGSIQRTDASSKKIETDLVKNEKNTWGFRIKNEWITTEDTIRNQKGTWSYNLIELNRPFEWNFAKLNPFIRGSFDRKIQKNNQTDSLRSDSYGQNQLTAGLDFSNTSQLQLSFETGLRIDESVFQNDLIRESDNLISKATVNYRPNSGFSSENELTFLKRKVQNEFLQSGITDQDAIFITSNSKFKNQNKSVEMGLIYDVNTQRTAILQETYIDVGPELGQYVWEDLNADGVKQIDEFFPEQTPNEGTYLKQFLPSDELMPSISMHSRFRFEWNPILDFDKKSKSPWKKWAEMFDFRSDIDIRERSVTSELATIYLLNLSSYQNDSTTINGRINIRNEISLFPTIRIFSLRLGSDESWGKNRQVYGSESSRISLQRLEISNRINRYWLLNHKLVLSSDKRENNSISSRVFLINSVTWESQVNWNYSRSIQSTLEGAYSLKKDSQPEIPVKSRVWRSAISIRTFIGDKWQGNGRIQLRNVNLDGTSAALGTFELTEGAGDGTTWLWSSQLTYRNSSFVQTSFNYDGRTIQNRPSIHTIRLVIRALF